MIYIDRVNNKSQVSFANKEYDRQNYKYRINNKNFNPKQNEIITLEEGFQILGKGLSGQFKDTLNMIIQNPLKSIAGFVGISTGIMLLPFIGIPSAVGGGALAVGFAGIALGKAVYHSISFVNSNKDGSRNIARYHLEQVGRDSFDMAISMPFVPKSLTNLNKFRKYGKVGINKDLITKIQNTKGLYRKVAAIRNSDKNLFRSINFHEAVDNELALITDMSEAEKLSVKQELLTYNIPEEELPNLILEQIAQKEGVHTKPDFKFVSMPKNTQGVASQKDCTIFLNDNKSPFLKDPYDAVVLIKREVRGGTVFAKFKDFKTGKIYDETIDLDVLNEFNSRCESYRQLTPQARRILTTIHERTHIKQFARLIQLKGYDIVKDLTPRGRQLYEQMIRQMAPAAVDSVEVAEAESLVSFQMNPTFYNYIKRPYEIGARKSEIATFNSPVFKKLNTVFEYTNKQIPPSIESNVIMNDARWESVQN